MRLTPQPPQRQARAMQLSASLSTISSAAPQLGRVLLTWPRPAAASPGPAPSVAPAAAAPQTRLRRCRRAPHRRCRSGRGRRLIGAAAPGLPMRRMSCGSDIAQLNSLGVHIHSLCKCAGMLAVHRASTASPSRRPDAAPDDDASLLAGRSWPGAGGLQVSTAAAAHETRLLLNKSISPMAAFPRKVLLPKYNVARCRCQSPIRLHPGVLLTHITLYLV